MIWTIKWTPKAIEYVEKLPGNISERILRKIDSIRVNPFHYLEHYEGEDIYKLRIGNYRALIDIDFQNKILKVRVVGHRKKIYKRL